MTCLPVLCGSFKDTVPREALGWIKFVTLIVPNTENSLPYGYSC